MPLIHLEILEVTLEVLPETSPSLQCQVQPVPQVKDVYVHTLKVRISAQNRLSLAGASPSLVMALRE